ncbi:MAG: enoyl-CoA hydratase [Firmicutes bacterium HGW-Firmicutes-15]|nr:MAG: enoyl-CoA hydratase [Firmicutes bacterium HGW-Firmicutes-15]
MAVDTTQQQVQLHVENNVATVTLNAPPANALSQQMMDELGQTFAELAGADIAAIILTGRGDHSFSAGANLEELAKHDESGNINFFAQLYQILDIVSNVRFPVIAAINGFAMGAGFELALCADIRIMNEKALLCAAGVNIGLVYCTQRLPRLIGYGLGKELVFTGRKISAAEALATGIVQYVTPSEELIPRARELARLIAQKPAQAVQASKQAMNEGFGLSIREGHLVEAKYLNEMFAYDDFHQRVNAFLNKEK